MYFLDDETQNELKPELLDGEKLLWTGRPKKGVVFQLFDIYFIPFAVFWLYQLVKMSPLMNGNVFSAFDFMLIPFFLFGLFFLFGRFLWDSKKRAATFYGVTKSRILIKSGIFFKDIKTIEIKSIPKITIRERNDGSGTITFYTEVSWYDSFGLKPNWKSDMPAFELIENPNEVYNTILAIKEN